MMNKALFQEMSPEARISALKANADLIEKQNYMKTFTPEELEEMKAELAEVSIKLNDIAEAKKAANDGFKTQEKEPKAIKAGLLKNLKEKAVSTEEECFKMVDQDAGEVGYYNHDGILVFARPILPSERQTNLYGSLRKAD